MISIEEKAQALRVRQAALDGVESPSRLLWLHLVPPLDDPTSEKFNNLI